MLERRQVYKARPIFCDSPRVIDCDYAGLFIVLGFVIHQFTPFRDQECRRALTHGTPKVRGKTDRKAGASTDPSSTWRRQKRTSDALDIPFVR